MQFESTLLIGIILSCITPQVRCQDSFQKCVTSTGWRIGTSPSVTHMADGNLPCINSCVRSSVCHAAHFSSATSTCQHYKRGAIIMTVEEGSVDDHVVFVRNITGLMVGKVPGYQYTYLQAVAACASLGGRIMTSQELSSAYQNGFEMCRCGWLEGNLMQFPMQSAMPGCGMTIGLVDCTYTLGDAWCQV